MRLIDYLVTRKDVDAARIGLTGISKGGIETYLTAAADPRVAAAVPYIGVQSFKWALDNGAVAARGSRRSRTASTRRRSPPASRRAASPSCASSTRAWCPASMAQFDGPAMLPLIAPRPLLVINADSDANTPDRRCAACRWRPRSRVYAAANAADKLQLVIEENTPHRVNPESIDAGIAWFVRWLKP